MAVTPYHAKFWAYELTRRAPADSVDRLATALVDAQVDLNPHQVDAALFAFRSPLSKGVLLADEVGLGKTIEAGLVISQKWAERKRRVLVVTPSNLRKQWHQELSEKFFLPCTIIESKPYNDAIKRGQFRPFERDSILICSYQFARNKAADVSAVPWDLVVMDEAHRLRNVYKPGNIIANTLKQALAHAPKLLLTATPLQNSLLELFGLVSFLDDQVFGDVKSFREQFLHLSEQQVFNTLKARLKPVCQRTLRRQVTTYISYTRRLPMAEHFSPDESEDRLTLDTGSWNYQALSEELFLKHLRTHETEIVKLSATGLKEKRLEDYVVAGLIDFDDVSYDGNADLLYELAGQAVRHFRSYLSEDDTQRVLRAYQRPIATNIHAQMHEPGHYWEKVTGYHVEIRAGFTPLKTGAFSTTAGEGVIDYRVAPTDRTKIQQILYGGFSKCLHGTQRFQANNERQLAVILDRDSQRWFKPLKDQFQIFYKMGLNQAQYVPDFVAETKDTIWMIEGKARNQLGTPEVARKREAAEEWCSRAGAHAATYGGKPWKYALVPDDVVDENMSLDFLVRAGLIM